MKKHIHGFEYVMLSKSIQPRCDLTIWELGRGQELFEPRKTYVVMFSEPTDGYEGVSVTNGCEHIATAVWVRTELHESDHSRIIWIEHYPPGSLGRVPGLPEETFDLVTFDWKQTYYGPMARRPVWHRVSREWVEELVKEEI